MLRPAEPPVVVVTPYLGIAAKPPMLGSSVPPTSVTGSVDPPLLVVMVSLPVGWSSVPESDVGGGDESPLDVASSRELEVDETEAMPLAVVLVISFPVVSVWL